MFKPLTSEYTLIVPEFVCAPTGQLITANKISMTLMIANIPFLFFMAYYFMLNNWFSINISWRSRQSADKRLLKNMLY